MMRFFAAVFAVMLGLVPAGWAGDAAVETVRVPVLVKDLQPGDSFDGATEMRDLPKARVFAGTVRVQAELEDSMAARAMEAGKPVLKLQVKPDYPVNRNSTVSFKLQRGGIELTGNGTALEDGALGSTIKVLNTATRSTIAAVVTGPGQVEIQ